MGLRVCPISLYALGLSCSPGPYSLAAAAATLPGTVEPDAASLAAPQGAGHPHSPEDRMGRLKPHMYPAWGSQSVAGARRVLRVVSYLRI